MSYSSVMPTPPNIWIASFAHQDVRLRAARLGQRDELRASGAPSSTARAAAITAERDSSISMNRRAARCLSAWKVPMTAPNCSRVFRWYSRVGRRPRSCRPASRRTGPRWRGRPPASSSAPPCPAAPTTRVGADLDAVELHDRGVRASRPAVLALDGDALRIGRHQEELDAVRVVLGARACARSR